MGLADGNLERHGFVRVGRVGLSTVQLACFGFAWWFVVHF